MKLNNRILSTLLAVLMLLGTMTGLSAVSVSAASDVDISDDIDENAYTTTIYRKPEDKLNTMTMMMENEDYQLWVDKISGEVATVKIATNEILFSNPYDVASGGGQLDTQRKVLSQLVVEYLDNGARYQLHSFEEAALREQIKVMNIKNGIRVEYTIGREETRKLLPRWISAESFATFIDGPMKEAIENGSLGNFYYEKFMTYYSLRGKTHAASQKELNGWLETYPCIEKFDIYVFDSTVGNVKENWCENYIKEFCEDYTFEQMDADHEETGYVAEDEKYPMFKMALEYSLTENGLSVRLPCNGLRYDMISYTLESLSVLPYMGAGNSTNEGYNFYPDGSGSLFSSKTPQATIRGKVYGVDYAYHNISNTYQKAIRYPVYGTVATETIYEYSYSYVDDKDNARPVSETVSSTIKSLEDIYEEIEKRKGELSGEIDVTSYKRGYMAIIESGESLAEIASEHSGTINDYYSMMNYFNPKPKDEYEVSNALSVTSASTWTVVSNRKYTGSLKINYVFLSDMGLVEEAKEFDPDFRYYEASWMGMAEAYRDYLVNNGTLTKLTDDDVKSDIPLYVEVFGTLETQQTIATIPVNVMTPLTTFENIYQMYSDFATAGVKNVNFKMTGFANGGMYSKVPSSLKWENAVGGKDKFEWLIEQSKEVSKKDADANLGLYPDFDFAYIQENTLFDAVNLKRDAIKTIDNRYTSFRQYSATQQTYVTFHQLAISPARFADFYNKLVDNYSKYDIHSMSIATLGNTLNSDFDEDEPYNREDNKTYTIEAFQDLEEKGYSLMTEGGNVYTWKYVDHIINMDLDSSRHVNSMASVPFLGAVLHGYVQFAGTPLNEEGDTDYAILKAIENGAGLYFILSYQNTNELKEDVYLSQYYGIRYDIWKDDAVEFYKTLNNLLKDVQTKVIVGHEFLEGERVLDLSELETDLAEKLQDAINSAQQNQINIETEQYVEIAEAWKQIASAPETVNALYMDMENACVDIEKAYNDVVSYSETLSKSVDEILTMLKTGKQDIESTMITDMLDGLRGQIRTIKSRAVAALQLSMGLENYKTKIQEALEDLKVAEKVIEKAVVDGLLSADVATAYIERAEKYYNGLQSYVEMADELLMNLATNGYTDENSSSSIVNVAYDAISVLQNEYDPYAKQLREKCLDVLFSKEDIKNSVVIDSGKDEEDDDDKKVVVEKETPNNNRIVSVTYGDRNAETYEKTAYKTFLLNYNSYAVRVTYNYTTYTIPSGGYVVIEHQN